LAESGLSEKGPFDQRRIDQENREVLAYVRCIRERGWNVADPEAWEGTEHPGLLDPPPPPKLDDPEAQDQYYRDAAECGFPVFDDEGNVLPLE
jgi:hypothetical protein